MEIELKIERIIEIHTRRVKTEKSSGVSCRVVLCGVVYVSTFDEKVGVQLFTSGLLDLFSIIF